MFPCMLPPVIHTKPIGNRFECQGDLPGKFKPCLPSLVVCSVVLSYSVASGVTVGQISKMAEIGTILRTFAEEYKKTPTKVKVRGSKPFYSEAGGAVQWMRTAHAGRRCLVRRSINRRLCKGASLLLPAVFSDQHQHALWNAGTGRIHRLCSGDSSSAGELVHDHSSFLMASRPMHKRKAQISNQEAFAFMHVTPLPEQQSTKPLTFLAA